MIWLPAGQPEAEHKASVADFISTLPFRSESLFPQITHFLIFSLPILIPLKCFFSPAFTPWAIKPQEIQYLDFYLRGGCIPHPTCAFVYPFKYILPISFKGCEMSSFLRFSLYLGNVNTVLNVRTAAWRCQTLTNMGVNDLTKAQVSRFS